MLEIVERLAAYGFTFGWSKCEQWDGLDLALQEVRKAADFGNRRGLENLTAFGDIWQDGVADLIDASDASHVARRMLGSLIRQDQQHDSELIETLRVWLSNHGKLMPAARELGVHRHTLANRMDQISQLTGSDLEDYQDRADLTLALRYFRR